MLEASLKQVRKAFLRNQKSGGALQGAHDAAKGMLYFYSAECGLKCLVMTDRGQKTTKQVAADFGHNIRRLVTAAKIAPSELAGAAAKEVKYPTLRQLSLPEAVSLNDFHVAARYGVDLNADDEAATIEFFETLIRALAKRLK